MKTPHPNFAVLLVLALSALMWWGMIRVFAWFIGK